MIIVLKPNADESKYSKLEKWIRDDLGLDIHYSRGEKSTILGLVGDTSHIEAAGLPENYRACFAEVYSNMEQRHD